MTYATMKRATKRIPQPAASRSQFHLAKPPPPSVRLWPLATLPPVAARGHSRALAHSAVVYLASRGRPRAELPRRTIRRPRSCATARPRQRGDPMPTVIAHHDVKDKDHWLASPKRE